MKISEKISLKTKKTAAEERSLPPSIGECFLGCRVYLGEGVFLMEDGALATFAEAKGLGDEVMTEEELTLALAPLKNFSASLITGFSPHKEDRSIVLQLILSQRLEIGFSPTKDSENKAGAMLHHEMLNTLGRGYAKRRFFITLRWMPEKKKGQFLKGFWEGLASPEKAAELFAVELRQQKAQLLKSLRRASQEASFKIEACSDKDFLRYTESVFQEGQPFSYSSGSSETEPLYKSLHTPPWESRPEGFVLEKEKRNISLFHLLEFPEEIALGRLSTFLNSLPLGNYEAVWTLSEGKKTPGAEHILKKMVFSEGPSYRERYEDLISVEKSCNALNPMVKASFKLITYDVQEGLEGEIFARGSQILGAPLIQEKEIATHLIAAALPMNASKDAHGVLGRFRTLLLDRALAFAPFYSAAKRKELPRQWVARNGEKVGIDLFQSGGNNHLTVLGNSESGKSCLISQCVLEFLWRFEGGVVRIVDRKTSYKKLCDLVGGKVISFNEKALKKTPYSPFAFENWDEEDVKNVVTFIASAIVSLSPNAELTSLHTEILEEAVKLAANSYLRSLEEYPEEAVHVTWPDIKKKLPPAAEAKGSASGEALDNLRQWTVPFDPTGQLGFLFCAVEKESVESAPIQVFDLDGIIDPKLQVIASQLAFLKISRDLKRRPRQERKLLVFEELGVLVRSESKSGSEIATQFIRSIVKTARKIGAQAIGISNELEDFTQTEAGKTFWKIATQKLFLPQSEAAKIGIDEVLAKELSSADRQIIRDLMIAKGQYSQAYLIEERKREKSSFLIPLSPLMFTLVSTDAEVEAAYESLLEEGMAPEQAMRHYSKTCPYGKRVLP